VAGFRAPGRSGMARLAGPDRRHARTPHLRRQRPKTGNRATAAGADCGRTEGIEGRPRGHDLGTADSVSVVGNTHDGNSALNSQSERSPFLTGLRISPPSGTCVSQNLRLTTRSI